MNGMEIVDKHQKKPRSRKFYFKLLLFLSFFGIFFFFVYTSFFGGTGLTGSLVGTGGIITGTTSENLINFSAEMTIPPMALEGKFAKVELSAGGNSFLQIGDQKSSLENFRDNYIVLENYEGEISFDEKEILNLDGRASGVTINGIFMTPNKKGTSRVSLQNPLPYFSLNIMDEVRAKKISHKTSGFANVGNGKNLIKLDNEQVSITNFVGDMKLAKGKIILLGKIQRIDVSGEQKVYVGV